MRLKDDHIMAVDREVFTMDERFQALFLESTSTWALLIKYATQSDEGEYECQVSTEPKLSHVVKLNVVGEYKGILFYFFGQWFTDFISTS